MIFLSEKLKIGFINPNKSKTISEKIIQVNLADFYCINLCQIISLYSPIKNINICHFSDLSINTRDYIYQFNHL